MDALGCSCPACGAEESEVRKTTKISGGTLRVRVCRQCGRLFPTMEHVLQTKEFSKKNSAI